jgi:hypothetical protein
MKRIGTIGAAAALLLLAGCEMTVNNKSVDNQVDAAASGAANLAEGAGNLLDSAGDAIENHAEALGNKADRLTDNGIDVNVDIGGGDRKDANAQ